MTDPRSLDEYRIFVRDELRRIIAALGYESSSMTPGNWEQVRAAHAKACAQHARRFTGGNIWPAPAEQPPSEPILGAK